MNFRRSISVAAISPRSRRELLTADGRQQVEDAAAKPCRPAVGKDPETAEFYPSRAGSQR